MDDKVYEYIDNISLVFMWVGAWTLTDMFILKYLKNYQITAYLILFIVGSILVFYG